MQMRQIEQLFVEWAARSLRGRLAESERGRTVVLPPAEKGGAEEVLEISTSAAKNPELAAQLSRLRARLDGVAQRAYAIGLVRDRLAEVFEDLAPPVLLVRVRITLDCALPQEGRWTGAVSLAGGPVRVVEDRHLAPMAAELLDSRLRVEPEEVARAVAAIEERLQVEARDRAEQLKSQLLTLQSRKKRDVETVFQARLMELEEGGSDNGDQEQEALRLGQEKAMALAQMERHFDPNSIRVSVEPVLVLLVEQRFRRRRRKGEVPHDA